MDAAPAPLESIYRPLIGRMLEGMSFMPLTNSDTSGVIANADKSALWFTGAICLGFSGVPDVFLTWWNRGDAFALIGGLETGWTRFSLDSLVMTRHEPWSVFEGAALSRVHLFAANFADHEFAVAAKHEFANGGSVLWIGVGSESMDRVGDGDDLYVGLEEPPNANELRLMATLE